MEYRHELKHRVNMADYEVLRARLRRLLKPDPNAGPNAVYRIRSLYFDNANDKALMEKIDGVNIREKFRIRCYNGSSDLIRLEKKSKVNSLNNKNVAELVRDQAEAIIRCNWEAIRMIDDPLVKELYSKMLSEQLRPKTIVAYTREAYVYPAGNVRITFDTGLKTGLFSTGLFDPHIPLVSPLDAAALLEVKYDAFLPDVVAKLLQLGDRHASAFSKYAACRVFA